MFDLVVRGGLVVDGTGAPARSADVAISDGVIVEVGGVDERGRREIDATGALVTPGFVDVHTHYDGQVTWDPTLAPSSWHGVTTAVIGNCGVGFAPVAPTRRDWLIGLMEGVEDIPGTALADGIAWDWESYPEYLDAVDRLPKALDIASHIPHGAVRAYVMGERGAANEQATEKDCAQMAAIVRDGLLAGAIGFSMSRTLVHKAVDGREVPGTFAALEEIMALGSSLCELGRGLTELAPAGVTGDDLDAPDREMRWMRQLAAATGRPVTYALVQHNVDPDAWRVSLQLAEEARRAGERIYPQVAVRSPSLLIGWKTKANPFQVSPTFAAISGLPLAQLRTRLQEPAVRDRILHETAADLPRGRVYDFRRLFTLGDPPDYEPRHEDSLAARAARDRVSPLELVYDILLERDGKEMLFAPLYNYSDFTLDTTREMILHPTTIVGLGDAGAHCGAICDASAPTYLLTHWSRDRRGDRIPIEIAVKKQTADSADLYGLVDRGRLAPGLKGDLNIIDHEALKLAPPEHVTDLPSGAGRLVQSASGYLATIVSGTAVREADEDTGERPGRLVRAPVQ